MTIPIILQDGRGTRSTAKVDPNGILAVGPIKSSTPKFNELDVIDTAFNFFEPVAGQRFVITGAIINATRTISVNGAVVEIYESDSVTSTTILKDLLTIDIGRGVTVPILPLQLDVAPGVFINAKTDSVDVNVTIAGYFLENFNDEGQS